MSNKLDMINKNHIVESEDALSGGSDTDTIYRPSLGGFPPIFVCKDDEKDDIIDDKKRLYAAPKDTISISKIMEKRRNITPFISS